MLYFHTSDPEIQAGVHDLIREWENNVDFFEVMTSGSTGAPKRIAVKKKFAKASAEMTLNYLDLLPGQNALLCLHPSTIAGKMMVIRSLVGGLNLHVVAPSSTPFEGLSERMDFAALVPLQMQQTIKAGTTPFFKGQQLIIGGAPISPAMRDSFSEVDAQVYHTFGMTETISHIAMCDVSAKSESYEALPGVAISVIDGRLCIDAPHLGVSNLSTNDCVYLSSERQFVWQGRLDFVVNSGGIKIHPEFVENELSKVIKVPFFVTGVPDNDLGERLVLCVEASTFELNKSIFSALLPKFHVPKFVYLFDQFERTASGKINRKRTLVACTFNAKSLL